MKCSHCSYQNPDDAKFCQNCGQRLHRVCPNCATPNAPDAKFCKECGTSLKTREEAVREDRITALQRGAPRELQERLRATSAQMEGERKLVTILFADIVGSTFLANRLDPEEWKEIVNGAHKRISQAIYRYEGTIAQLLGDGVLAFFGAPIIHEDDPQRAVRAGLAIQEAMEEYRRELAGYVGDFQVRVGLHTGTVVVGAVGDDLHMEYLAMGDAVNLAGRLQSAAAPGEVLLSRSTARLLGEGFALETLGDLALKGFPQPVTAFKVLTTQHTLHTRPVLPCLRSPMVGREAELRTLQGALSWLARGSGGVVAVLGDAGIGKSRLIEEALLAAPAGVRVLEGWALSYGAGLSFWTILQFINADLGVSEADPEPRVRVALRRRLQALFGESTASILPYIARLHGLKLDEDQAALLASLDGETLKHQTLTSLSDYFVALAQEQPTVLFFQDLHWADPSSLQALEKLLALTDRSALLLLLSFRPERDRSSWQVKIAAETRFPHRYTEIALDPLSEQDSDEIVNNLLELSQIPSKLRRLLLSRSEGNPLYLEEEIRGLIDTGTLVRDNGGWRLQGEIQQIEIPYTLQAVLLARIDGLQEDVRRTLQLASVIGRNFLYRLLETIDQPERELDRHLSELQRLDLVREKTRQPELEYIFKHSLIQEAAYNSLLLELRKKFHKRVGEALEELFADRKEEYLGLLAHHFDRAEEEEKAISYLLDAGDKARYSDSLEEAVQHYQRAIERLQQTGDERTMRETWLKLGMVYHNDFDFENAHRSFGESFALQREAGGHGRRRRGQDLTFLREHTLRIGVQSLPIFTLDPGKMYYTSEQGIGCLVYTGIARFDEEMNLVPYGAISWEVLEGGKRYRIHLRDDVRWSDGRMVTAADYEWAWKRNLTLPGRDYPRQTLDCVVGARDFRIANQSNPDQIGVHALDDLTLEVLLEAPLAYFPYLLASSTTYPLPRRVVEQYREEWWYPEHIISNGTFLLKEFAPGRVSLERNPDYFGDFEGNAARVELVEIKEEEERLRLLLDGELDLANALNTDSLPSFIAAGKTVNSQVTSCLALGFAPPLDDIRVRRALVHGLDRKALALLGNGVAGDGGLVPPGVPGHSPEINLPHDLPLARRFLAEAGFPGGKGFPRIPAFLGSEGEQKEITRQWREGLGIEVSFAPATGNAEIRNWGWMADYPDPDNYLREGSFLSFLRERGWHDPEYDALVERAAKTYDRAERMVFYRKADRRLIDQVLVVPLGYNMHSPVFHNQRISGFREKISGIGDYSKVCISENMPHSKREPD